MSWEKWCIPVHVTVREHCVYIHVYVSYKIYAYLDPIDHFQQEEIIVNINNN